VATLFGEHARLGVESMSKKKELVGFADVESDERFIRVQERFSRAEERKQMFGKLSTDTETRLRKERIGPRPVLRMVEREIHQSENDWSASQRKLEDLKLQSKIRRAEIARAEEEFRYTIHKDVDLENPVELDTRRVEAAKKKLEAKVKHIIKEIGDLEKKIPDLIQEELNQRGRLEQFKIQRESIRSGFRDIPFEKDPRMTSLHKERRRIEKEFDDVKIERDDVAKKVRRAEKRKQGSLADKPPRTKRSAKKGGS
jgi:chromosome segregation ATPase